MSEKKLSVGKNAELENKNQLQENTAQTGSKGKTEVPHIILKDVNKIYPNGFHAVHDFNLEIYKGEFIVFVGSSGCGKSTTLRMIAGLENISKGEFIVDGKLANDMSPRDRGIAMVFQSYALYPNMSVFENLAFGLTLEGVDEEEIEEKVLAVAKILGLTDYLDRKPRALSGGQRQRVAVGRAIIRKVDIFLMDEPLSNLDAKQRVTMRSEITSIHKSVGSTTIYVTHDQTEAMTMADRIVCMKEGYIQQVGTPYELYFKPTNMFVAGFIGEPPMNFIEGKIENGMFVFNNVKLDAQKSMSKKNLEAYEGKEVVMGFRPEHIKLMGQEEQAYKLDCEVELCELLGDNTNIYIKMGELNSILKVDPHDAPEEDIAWSFLVPYKSVYWFDKKTENVIVNEEE